MMKKKLKILPRKEQKLMLKCADLYRCTFSLLIIEEKVYLFKSAHFNLKDMKVTSIRDFNSHKSNSLHDDQKENLAPNSVNDRKRFLNPPKRKPKLKKFDF